uniref:Uncharacterized protein n=1 Tax=Arcella intermedia TaxID=1963864 RepID=A0A6B2LSZ7_9EUKA
MLCFDITNIQSFLHVKYWLEEMRSFFQEYSPLYQDTYLVGTKIDLWRNRVISTAQGEALAQYMGLCGYFEVSSKEQVNLKEMIQMIVDNYVKNHCDTRVNIKLSVRKHKVTGAC